MEDYERKLERFCDLVAQFSSRLWVEVAPQLEEDYIIIYNGGNVFQVFGRSSPTDSRATDHLIRTNTANIDIENIDHIATSQLEVSGQPTWLINIRLKHRTPVTGFTRNYFDRKTAEYTDYVREVDVRLRLMAGDMRNENPLVEAVKLYNTAQTS